MNLRYCVVIAALIIGCGDNGAKGSDAGVPGDGTATGDAAPAIPGLDKRPTNATCKAFSPPAATGTLALVPKFPNLHFSAPTGMF
ncbi:MAG TPA: hypothetical protein VGC41_16565, partial [Kofleriaceae bacterium]